MDETFGAKYFWFRKWIFYLVFQLQLIGWPLWNFFGLQVHDWEAAFEVGYCYIHSSKSYHNFSSELYLKKKKTFSTFYLTVYEMNLYTYRSHSFLTFMISGGAVAFLEEYRCSPSRTTFHYTIGRLSFMEHNPVKFKSSMDPLLQVLTSLSLSLSPTCVFNRILSL